IAAAMVGGGILASLVLVPAIHYFGAAAGGIVVPGTTPIGAMSAADIRGAYILYIGAGAVTMGGLISLVRSLPTIVRSVRAGFGDIGAMRSGGEAARPRTEQDLPLKLVFIGMIALVGAILVARSL